MSKKLSRRTFLQVVGGGMSTIAIASCMPIVQQPEEGPATAGTPTTPILPQQGETFVRRSVTSLLDDGDPDGIMDTYANAVGLMKELDQTNPDDPRGWTKQAEIHFGTCPHGNWFFLPWHAAYLHYFEEICRELTGVESFALPYWNWSLNPSIPDPFWGENNPLFDDTRAIGPDDPMQEQFVSPSNMEEILSIPNFQDFASHAASSQRPPEGEGRSARLEGEPHNMVHVRIGGVNFPPPNGNMNTFMSPLDPVFWMHHGMIDNCWADWLTRDGHGNSAATEWLDYEFEENFVDRDGQLVTLSVAETIELQNSYIYDAKVNGEPYDPAQMATLRVQTETIYVTYEVAEKREAIELSIDQPVIEPVTLDVNRIRDFLAENQDHRLALTLGDVENPIGGNVYIEVAINPTNEVREFAFDTPNFITTFGFFIDPSHVQHNRSTNHTLDITDNLRTLHGAGELPDLVDLNIQLTAKLHYENEDDQAKTVVVNALILEFREPQ